MSTCFVIQPFDEGPFDKRYEDVFQPAIDEAGLEAYRVDRDPSVSIPIEEIEEGIRNAQVCLADISNDNPNVWFELGFAIAIKKDVVLICSADRDKHFPFDVQHRTITSYSTESPRDFELLRRSITDRIIAVLEKQKARQTIKATPIADVKGLSQHEMVAISALAEHVSSPDDSVAPYLVRQEMSKAGFTGVAATVAISSLMQKGMIESRMEAGAYDAEYKVICLTRKGMSWLISNEDKFVLKESSASNGPVEPDDIPF